MTTFRQARRAIVARNASILAMDDTRADILAAIGVRIARGERVGDVEIAGACGAEAEADDDDGRGQRLREQAAKLAQPMFVTGPRGGRTAVVSFRGVVDYDLEFQPYFVSTKQFARTMRDLAADDSVRAIVLIVDSPGGVVTGTPEAADAVFAARETKKVTAVVDTMAASAAYWIVSQASEIVTLASADGVGSIGVRMMHLDCSEMLKADGIAPTFIYAGEFKVEGNSFQPLAETARAHYQGECDLIYADFVKAVARGRGVSASDVKEKFGKGRMLRPADAKRVGMLDRIEETDASLRRLGLVAAPAQSRRAEAGRAEFATVHGVTYATVAWPEVIAIDLDAGWDPAMVAIAGDVVTITVANGSAVYDLIEPGSDAAPAAVGLRRESNFDAAPYLAARIAADAERARERELLAIAAA